jgi:teichuronic acid biosynthesis glycosyltransferase TuaG
MVHSLNPKVSVVMPAYNAERYVAIAVGSVTEQTFQDWELIVVDNSSSDSTGRIVKELADKDNRIRLKKCERNTGAAGGRNLALMPVPVNMLHSLTRMIYGAATSWTTGQKGRGAGADIIYSSYSIVDENGKKCRSDFVVEEETDFSKMLSCNVMGCSTVMLRGSAAETHSFSNDYYHEDYVLWLQLLKEGYKAVGISDVLVDYRMLENSRSGNKRRAAVQRWKVYRDYFKLPLYRSVVLFAKYAVNGVKKYR